MPRFMNCVDRATVLGLWEAEPWPFRTLISLPRKNGRNFVWRFVEWVSRILFFGSDLIRLTVMRFQISQIHSQPSISTDASCCICLLCLLGFV